MESFFFLMQLFLDIEFHTTYGAPCCSPDSLTECSPKVSSAAEKQQLLVCRFLLAGPTGLTLPTMYKRIWEVGLSHCACVTTNTLDGHSK